jgi:hypothetical protein
MFISYCILCLLITVNEVDQLEFEWQDYDRFKGTFRVDPTQGVYKVKFPVTEAGKEPRANYNGSYSISYSWNFATTGQGKSVNELVVAEWSKVKNWAYWDHRNRLLTENAFGEHKVCLLQFASVEIPIERLPLRHWKCILQQKAATKYVKIS